MVGMIANRQPRRLGCEPLGERWHQQEAAEECQALPHALEADAANHRELLLSAVTLHGHVSPAPSRPRDGGKNRRIAPQRAAPEHTRNLISLESGSAPGQ